MLIKRSSVESIQLLPAESNIDDKKTSKTLKEAAKNIVKKVVKNAEKEVESYKKIMEEKGLEI